MASYVYDTTFKILPVKILFNIYVNAHKRYSYIYAHKLLLLSTLLGRGNLFLL